jgi:hypothetical protein
MNFIQRTAVALAAVFCAAGAHADTLFTSGPTGAMATPSSVVDTFEAGAGAGQLALQLQGYRSLDGDGYYVDIFHLLVNGAEVFSGTWALGGGGTDRVLANPNGGTANHVGRVVDLKIPVSFIAGSNTVTFSYASPTSFEGSRRAGVQGLGDEGWGLNSVTATGNAVAPVPEPQTYALLLGGLGLIVFVAGRRSKRR